MSVAEYIQETAKSLAKLDVAISLGLLAAEKVGICMCVVAMVTLLCVINLNIVAGLFKTCDGGWVWFQGCGRSPPSGC